MISGDVEAKMQRLVDTVRAYESTVVAFSGGVDSALVAKASFLALGDWAIAATSDSPTLPREELEEAFRVAGRIGIRMYALERNELDDPNFAANPFNRCYFCKKGLQEDLQEFAKEIQAKTVTYGVNLDDLHEWRPGIEATRELGARFPLVEAGFTKADIRAAAQAWGLDVWDKPSSPCLASRVPYGEAVTEEKLRRIDQAEAYLHQLGFRECRVRHIDGVARIEVPTPEVPRLQQVGSFVAEWIRGLGFKDVLIDARGLRSGRMNEEYREAFVDGGEG